MPRVRSNHTEVVGILCSDIHLSLKPPISRAGEPDWFKAMARPLREITELASSREYACPILCAGDIFDKWNSPPELINFAIANLPKMYAVPGQHDLPLHNYQDIHKSAYWTLVEAGVIENLDPEELPLNAGFYIYPFPWGHPITPPSSEDEMKVAVVHQYIWMDKATSYPGAPEENKLTEGPVNMGGYDVMIFGDNHKGFLTQKGNCTVLNCGGFMRRNADQIDYKPHVGLLLSDGSVKLHYLDISEDIIEAKGPIIDIGEDMELQEFMSELMSLEESTLNFEEAMEQTLKKIKPNKAVKNLILEAMG